MKKLFSLLIFVALFATVVLLVACQTDANNNNSVIDYPEDEVPHVHKFTEKTYQSTCDVEGYTEHTCKDCGYYYRDAIQPINPKNHTYYDAEKGKYMDAYVESEKIVAKDCSEKNVTIKTCSECGNVSRTESIPSCYFDLEKPDEIVLPTCTEKGKNVYYCHVPGCLRKNAETGELNKKEVDIPCAGHLWDEWIIDVPATCSLTHVSEGVKHRNCLNCDESQDNVTILPHTSSAVGKVVEPTCTTVGYTVYVCDDCGVEYKRDFREPIAHELELKYEIEGTFYYGCQCGYTLTTDKKLEE
ncbi:MAG: hypothetical protein IKA84_00985 [Clostridia bacterium]|nr:hypothetical protein [Clostridia bacterium]